MQKMNELGGTFDAVIVESRCIGVREPAKTFRRAERDQTSYVITIVNQR